jgi:hypothetical protein
MSLAPFGIVFEVTESVVGILFALLFVAVTELSGVPLWVSSTRLSTISVFLTSGALFTGFSSDAPSSAKYCVRLTAFYGYNRFCDRLLSF